MPPTSSPPPPPTIVRRVVVVVVENAVRGGPKDLGASTEKANLKVVLRNVLEDSDRPLPADLVRILVGGRRAGK